MDELKIVLQIVQIISTLFIAFVGWYITVKYNRSQQMEIEQKYKPYLIITKLINNSRQTDASEFFGESKVPSAPYEKISNIITLKETGLLDKFLDKKGNSDSGSVYHMMYRNNRHLIFNFLQNDRDVIFDSAPTIIVIKNIGYDLCSYYIDSVKIYYKNGGKKTLKSKENWQQKYVPSQQEFYLLLSMVTNNNNSILCDINGLEQESKITLDKRVDLLEVDFSNNFLDYNKMDIFFVAKSSLSKEYHFIISIVVEGDRLCSFTKENDNKKKYIKQ